MMKYILARNKVSPKQCCSNKSKRTQESRGPKRGSNEIRHRRWNWIWRTMKWTERGIAFNTTLEYLEAKRDEKTHEVGKVSTKELFMHATWMKQTTGLPGANSGLIVIMYALNLMHLLCDDTMSWMNLIHQMNVIWFMHYANTSVPSLLDYPGVSCIQTKSPALPHKSPNLPDKTNKRA